MINLRTGVPGSGKTLSMVQELANLFKRWESHPEELRPVFVHNIPNLAFPVAAVPFKPYQLQKGMPPVHVPDWESMPDGSLVLIDECQGDISKNENIFPPRASGSIAPPHIAWLNTHRHKGFDLWITTQHPKLIDSTVRALVGKHQHFRRVFGGARAIIYEWDSCNDNLSNLKNAVSSYWSYPKKVFQWYKSAEIHTKQKFKIPRWAFIPVIGFVMLAVFVPRAYSIMFGGGIKHTAPASGSSAVAVGALSSAEQGAAKDGALAPAVAAPKAFPSVSGASDASATPQSVVGDRKPSDLRLAAGVYGDDPSQPAHFTADELEKQARAVAVLDQHIRDGRYTPIASPDDKVTHIVYIDPTDRYGERHFAFMP
ncbi:zonular occludens toxin (Zot) [mine drainage metagenome]|uniref:Zonular occludens toxin (Zot) n=1 Tax=mine drainage metagenome TaxID=410659 RepID=A0A1J5SR16_9ZZZZ